MLINAYDVFLEILKPKNKYSYIKLHMITLTHLSKEVTEKSYFTVFKVFCISIGS